MTKAKKEKITGYKVFNNDWTCRDFKYDMPDLGKSDCIALGNKSGASCKGSPYCYYKQLKRKEQECEEWKHQAELGSETTNRMAKELDQLKAENEELNEKAIIAEDNFACEIQARLYHQNEWLKISKENEILREMLFDEMTQKVKAGQKAKIIIEELKS